MKSILLSIVGLILGAVSNGILVQVGTKLIAAPAGHDFSTEAGLKAGMAAMEPKHFLFPFLAHALGTFIGAFGANTSKAIEDAGLNLHIIAPAPQVPSMVAALEKFLVDKIKTK